MTTALSVLGPLTLSHGDVKVDLRPAHRRVLAALAVEPGQRLSPDALIDAVWGDAPPGTAVNTLQVHISRIRSRAGDVITTIDGDYELNTATVTVDRDHFERLANLSLRPPGDDGWQPILDGADEALRLWRGAPYDELPDDPRASAARTRLDELRMAVAERRIEAMLALGREEAALADLAGLVELNPLRERLWEYLMLCHYRLGRQTDALRAYRRVAHILGDELGIEPGPRLRDLEEEILRHVPDAGHAALSTTPTNLPRPASPILGRDAAARDVIRALEAHRLVSLSGESGVGKSRLAIDIGWRMVDQLAGGVFLVDLANASDDAGLVAAISTGLQLATNIGDPSKLGDALRGRPMLLILDGADHVRAPLAEVCAKATTGLDPMILITTRRPLRLPGAHPMDISPLEVPDGAYGADETRSSPALRLLFDRARTASSEFRAEDVPLGLASRVVRSTGGNPLAIEIAGRWIASLGAATYLDLRSGFPERGATGDIDLALDALAPVDRDFLADISIIAGDGSLDSFAAVGSPERSRVEIVGSIARLVDAGLLSPIVSATGSIRYSMPAAVGESARLDGLRRDREGEIRERHAHHFRSAAHDLIAIADSDIDAMMPDFRLAVEWWLDEDPATASSIANALAPYWVARYLTWDGLHWYERILDAVDEPDLDTLWWSGWVAYNANEHATALEQYARLEALAQEGTLHHARAVYGEARLSVHAERSAAESRLERCLEIFRDQGSNRDITECLMALGMSKAGTGDHQAARPLLEEALDLLGPSGDSRQRALCERFLSLAAFHADDASAAQAHADRAVTIARQAADIRIWCGTLLQLALVEATWGSVADAARTMTSALEPIPTTAWYDTMLVLNGAVPVLTSGGHDDAARSVVRFIDDTMAAQGWQPLYEVNPVYAEARLSLGPIPPGTPPLTDVRSQAEEALAAIAAS